MKQSRKKTRRHLVQKLHARIYCHVESESFNEAFFDDRFNFELDNNYMEEMYHLIIEKQCEILDIIAKYAPKFDIETMLKTNILSLAIAISEMLWLKEEIPAKVSINEAIELSKYYGDDMSKNIVNWILNSFFENLELHVNNTSQGKTNLRLFCD